MRRLAVLAACVGVVCGARAASPEPALRESVEVSRVLLDARVVGRGGVPVDGLTASDFVVRIDGRPARVEAADRVGPEPGQEARDGRLLVLFFQRHVEQTRTEGLLRIAPVVARMVDALDPEVWVAVAAFDSRLSLLTDFTRDHSRVAEVVRRDVVMGERPRWPLSEGGPSLAAALDSRDLRRAWSVETSLRLLAEALQPMPGAKSLAYFCTGLGRLTEGGIQVHRDFGPAMAALLRGRTAVFSLDLVQADLHSLQEPLRELSRATGGFYEKTYVLPSGDVRRLASAIEAHYVLTVESPVPRGGEHRVEVALARGVPGTVHARDRFAD
jgi:hypothetical protein